MVLHMHTIRTLLPWEASKFQEHLKRLDPEDRRLRFGHALCPDGIDAYVRRIDWLRDRVLVAIDGDGEIVGAVHISRLDNHATELAFSVESGHRNRGVGTALAERAVLAARNLGYRRAHIYCLCENLTMRRLAVRCGMKVTCHAGDCEGCQLLEPATPMTWLRELFAESFGQSAAAVYANSRRLGLLRPTAPTIAA